MYLKGKMKIRLKTIVRNGNEINELMNYVSVLNNKFPKSKLDFTTSFYLKNNGEYKNTYEQSFEDIVNSILNDDSSTNNVNDDKFQFKFYINYFAKTHGDKMSENDVKNAIESFVKNANTNITKNSKDVEIISHELIVEKPIDAFDEIVHNRPSELANFYKGLLNEEDISVLSNTIVTCKIAKKEISNIKFNEEAILKEFTSTCKNDKISSEIHRIFTVSDNKNIQGVNYLFKEDNYEIRQNAYRALATALYAKGRLENPYYYIVKINVSDNNTASNVLYLDKRFKISRNELYFFEFGDAVDNDYNLYGGMDFNSVGSDFFKSLQEYQFVNIFGLYVNESAHRTCYCLEEKDLVEKLSLVVFTDKLNKEAQLLYIENKLKKFNQMDLFPAVKDVIEYQNTQVDGLSTQELDDYLLSFLKSKYEKVYRPVYEHITKDMSNGNMTAKLMNLVGCKNLKQAVSEMCNKVTFKNIKEDLIPATKILNEMCSYERNNWILTGVPGTGKSTTAEMLEKVMYQEKIIKKDLIVKYTPSKADSEIIMTPFGPMSTAKSSNDLHESFAESIGGVLIIDEIGHLTDEDKSLLLQLMEEYKRDVCVILCGYENEAKDLLDYNPGFRSRFTHIIKMEEYNTEELLQILKQKLEEKHFTVNEEAEKELKTKITYIKQVPNFGQARFMESMSDKLIAIHSNNKLREIENALKENPDAHFDEKEIYAITKDDVSKIPLDDMLGEEWTRIKDHKDAYSELNNLIGCNEVKKEVEKFVARSKVDKLKVERKFAEDKSFNMNMVFYGSPGTAKTTVARLLARIMYEKGIIPELKFTEVGAADLVGAYVGHTAIKTTNVFEEAKGGVLFIDEAYTLANERAGGFNQEAIDTIIKEMENNRSDTLVIFAGYKDKMEEFIKCNPGFKSRISKYIDFPNYNIDELLQIFNKLCKDNNYTLDENDKDKILSLISDYLGKIKDDKQFGNGRECRNILENAINMQSDRIVSIDDISDENLMKLKYEDFKFLEEDINFGVEEKRSIGFAA